MFIGPNSGVFPGNVHLENQFQFCTAIYNVLRHCDLFTMKLSPVIAGFCIENKILVEFNFDIYNYCEIFCMLFSDLSVNYYYEFCGINTNAVFNTQFNYNSVDFVKHYLSLSLFCFHGDVVYDCLFYSRLFPHITIHLYNVQLCSFISVVLSCNDMGMFSLSLPSPILDVCVNIITCDGLFLH
jgi:hypothetical protein